MAFAESEEKNDLVPIRTGRVFCSVAWAVSEGLDIRLMRGFMRRRSGGIGDWIYYLVQRGIIRDGCWYATS